VGWGRACGLPAYYPEAVGSLVPQFTYDGNPVSFCDEGAVSIFFQARSRPLTDPAVRTVPAASGHPADRPSTPADTA